VTRTREPQFTVLVFTELWMDGLTFAMVWVCVTADAALAAGVAMLAGAEAEAQGQRGGTGADGQPTTPVRGVLMHGREIPPARLRG